MIKGSTIRKARERIGESQLQFAKRFNVHQMTISRWERGDHVPRGPAVIGIEKILAELEATDA